MAGIAAGATGRWKNCSDDLVAAKVFYGEEQTADTIASYPKIRAMGTTYVKSSGKTVDRDTAEKARLV